MKILWKEVFKFLSGVTLTGAIVNTYLSLNNITIPLFSMIMTPEILGFRAVGHFAMFLAFFYFGYLRGNKFLKDFIRKPRIS
jgi:hypothetical protein